MISTNISTNKPQGFGKPLYITFPQIFPHFHKLPFACRICGPTFPQIRNAVEMLPGFHYAAIKPAAVFISSGTLGSSPAPSLCVSDLIPSGSVYGTYLVHAIVPFWYIMPPGSFCLRCLSLLAGIFCSSVFAHVHGEHLKQCKYKIFACKVCAGLMFTVNITGKGCPFRL